MNLFLPTGVDTAAVALIMSASREEALTPDELRKRLYQTFKSKGLLDTLKVSYTHVIAIYLCFS